MWFPTRFIHAAWRSNGGITRSGLYARGHPSSTWPRIRTAIDRHERVIGADPRGHILFQVPIIIDSTLPAPAASRSRRSTMPRLLINGQAQEVDDDPDTPLLWVLRDTLGLTGTKYGCGIAQCGACTVHIGGVATRSCSLPVGSAEGAEITTIE